MPTTITRAQLTTDIVLAGVFAVVCLPFALLGGWPDLIVLVVFATALAVRQEPAQAGPFTVELEFDAVHLAGAAAVVPGVERTGEQLDDRDEAQPRGALLGGEPGGLHAPIVRGD